MGWLKIGRCWCLVTTTSGLIHAFESRLNVTSDRLNVCCEKEHKDDSKILGLSNWANGE